MHLFLSDCHLEPTPYSKVNQIKTDELPLRFDAHLHSKVKMILDGLKPDHVYRLRQALALEGFEQDLRLPIPLILLLPGMYLPVILGIDQLIIDRQRVAKYHVIIRCGVGNVVAKMSLLCWWLH